MKARGKCETWTLDSWTGLWTESWTRFWTDAQFNDDHFQETADRSIEIEGTTMQASHKELAWRLLVSI